MSEVQKKLQELSENYQSLQAGKGAQKIAMNIHRLQYRARDSRRSTPKARVAAAGKHNCQEGAMHES